MIGVRDPMGLIGQTLDGQFRIDEFVGEGGFSVVYRGYHTGLGEIVAIKCLKLQSTLGSAIVESFVRRFRDEGRILYRLSQGNLHIVRSMASGTTIAGTTGSLVPYTVLEWLEGHSLAQDFERRRAAAMRGRPVMEAAALFSTAFEAVAYAHQAGVVHRDLNPGNIFLTQTREGVKAKVLDFGVAKIVSDHALELGPRAQTLGQIKIFSPAYAAPEQFDDKLGKIGPYTDVYTLAIVFTEALRDEPTIGGDNIAALIGETLDENRRPTPRTLGLEVSDAVEKVFARATAIKPQDRQQSAGEFWNELAGALSIRNISLPSASMKTPSPQDVAPRKPQFGTQTVRMESPMQNAKPAPSAPAIRIGVGASGLASTVAADDMDGRFSATMIAPENLGTQPTLAAPALLHAMQQPQTQPMQPALQPPPPHPSQPNMSQPNMQSPAYGAPPMNPPPPILPLQQAASQSGAGFNDETGIVHVSRGPSPLVYVIVGAILLLIGVVIAGFLYSRHSTMSVTPIPSASAISVVETATATATATATVTATATATATATTTATSLSTSTSAPTSTSTSVPTSTSTSTSLSTSTSTSTPSPTPIDPNAFNATAANRALATQDSILVSCADARGQKGTAHVTFANDGTVQNVTVDPAAMPGASCVTERYKTAHTLRFEGPPETVDHAFHIAK